jgi:predicted TIM-barrel fold metal-dependent hydrolase
MIDAHHHLWDLTQVTYPWLEAKGSERFFGQPDPIRKNYSPADYQSDHLGVITKSVHIQVGCLPEHNLKETQLIESYIAKGAPIAAIVPAVDVTSSELLEQLTAQQAYPHVKGVRHMIGKSPEENHQLPKFIGEDWIKGWRLIAKQGLTFDLQCTSEQYQYVFNALRLVPELKVAICHFGSPWNQTDVGFKDWQFWMAQFAQLPNCYIKLSGFSMFTHSFNTENFLQYATSAIETFSPERCMFGSNFPVDKLHMTYQKLMSAWETLLASYSTVQAKYITNNTAERFYSISS